MYVITVETSDSEPKRNILRINCNRKCFDPPKLTVNLLLTRWLLCNGNFNMWVQSSFVCSQCTTGSYRSIIYYFVFMIRHIRTNFTTRCSVVFKCACSGCFLSSSCKGLGTVSIVESRVRSVRVIRITIRVWPRGVAVFYGPPAGEVAWNVGVKRIKESELYKIER